MDLTKKILPSAVEVDGIFYPVKTEHYYWFNFARLIKKADSVSDFDFLYEDGKPADRQKGFFALLSFFRQRKSFRASAEHKTKKFRSTTKLTRTIFMPQSLSSTE